MKSFSFGPICKAKINVKSAGKSIVNTSTFTADNFPYNILMKSLNAAQKRQEDIMMEKTGLPLHEQINLLKDYLRINGYKSGSIKFYSPCWNGLMSYAASENLNTYTQKLGIRFLTEHFRTDLAKSNNKTSKKYIRGIKLLDSFILNGKMSEFSKRVSPAPKSFLNIAEEYTSYLQSLGQTRKSIKSKRSRIKQLFDFFEHESIHSITEVNKGCILAFMKHLTMKYSSVARSNILYTTKDFLLYCESKELVTVKLSALIKGIYTNQNEVLPSTYTTVEIARLLQSVDRSSAGGKKRYAILVLAAQLGIRSSDIISLKLKDIKWEQNTIEFYQCKSGFYVQLPMVDNVKYALLDYLKNSRTSAEYPNLFVRDRAPIAPYKEASIIYSIVADQMALAEIATTGKRHGPHALRHSMASSLLEEETPLTLIAAALGHNSTKNTSRYLRIDMERLRMVALEVPV